MTISPSKVFPLLRRENPVPLHDQPGGFSYRRKNHRHEGVDLYAEPGDVVRSISDGVVVATYIFTGPEVGMPWWHTTYATAVADDEGIWVYGETSVPYRVVGELLRAGDVIGELTPVLRVNKGRPTTMLHIERWKKHTAPHTFLWELDQPQPAFLMDPTETLLSLR